METGEGSAGGRRLTVEQPNSLSMNHTGPPPVSGAPAETPTANPEVHHAEYQPGPAPQGYNLQYAGQQDSMGDPAYYHPPVQQPGDNQEDYAMDAELVKLQEMTADARTHDMADSTANPDQAADATEDGASVDNLDEEMNRRSVYVGNVDYGSTPQDLQEHFNKCGKILRVTIMVDKYSGHPKGFAYIEFADASSANNALMLSNTTLRGRIIKVLPKRKNIAGMSRGRPYGRGRGRGAMMFGGPYGMAPTFMGPPVRGSAYAPRFRRGRTFRIA
eukprot:Protomagalhaensia_sp_Gyna_25__2420@NODE_2348_length_1135_cov_99_825730_g1946_i0_p1_GENE_NODE_2348_length_1135_cov_99_825730_g1946_i0NODE_2348_length_1135_cov_99_825730_g1946_i0_p1_ORF_typecomplete_len281_score25_22RRM_1/PF00076_22/2_4e19RRM_5/PF13893_6/4e07Nup35_RRM_2/PF14605_6/0_00054Nup35_RRM/PF05172_13/0_00092RRM_7/PF16367_5/0_0013RRM_Rrp7/PF17799_1/0_022DUF1866/PF08952_11/0_079RRM_occluded/PF16842_5/0_12_NODE_2348_length_1135_cov_99_825730_g1946_i02911112